MPTPLTVPSPDMARWLLLAEGQPAEGLRISTPIEVLLSEATDLARFVNDYLNAKRDADNKVVVPGLTMANRNHGKLRFDDTTALDLLGLMATAQAAQTAFNLSVGPKGSADVREVARKDLGEVQGAIELVLDDGVEDDRDRQLAKLDETHKETSNDDTLAAALADYAALAKVPEIYQQLTELSQEGGFDLGTVARCEAHANTIRLLPAAPAPKDPAAREAFAQRNQLVSLLQQRVRLVRAAARWVFRDHPAIARVASSAYERRQRAEARRRQAAEPNPS